MFTFFVQNDPLWKMELAEQHTYLKKHNQFKIINLYWRIGYSKPGFQVLEVLWRNGFLRQVEQGFFFIFCQIYSMIFDSKVQIAIKVLQNYERSSNMPKKNLTKNEEQPSLTILLLIPGTRKSDFRNPISTDIRFTNPNVVQYYCP